MSPGLQHQFASGQGGGQTDKESELPGPGRPDSREQNRWRYNIHYHHHQLLLSYLQDPYHIIALVQVHQHQSPLAGHWYLRLLHVPRVEQKRALQLGGAALPLGVQLIQRVASQKL